MSAKLDGIRIRAEAYRSHGTPGLHAPQDRAKLLAAVDAVRGMHRNEHRDQWGHPATEDMGAGGWCYNCGRFEGVGCPTIRAISAAVEAKP